MTAAAGADLVALNPLLGGTAGVVTSEAARLQPVTPGLRRRLAPRVPIQTTWKEPGA